MAMDPMAFSAACNLLVTYNKLRYTAMKNGDNLRYKEYVALQSEVQTASYSLDLNLINQALNDVLAI